MGDQQETLILRDVLIPGGRVADITIRDGLVLHIGAAGRGDVEIFCQDTTVLPAGTDLHVHMRDGVQKFKETWESGTKSAIAGGVTAVVDQPNTIPPLISPDLVRDRVFLAASQAYCRFAINGAVTGDSDLTGMYRAGVFAFGETFAGPSSYGEAVDFEVLSKTMKQISSWNGIMTIHAEQVTEGTDDSLTRHDALRSVSGEVQTVQDVLNLNSSQCNLHFCHLSSAQAIQSVPVGTATVEVTPHHLFLSKDTFSPDDPKGKVNPPLRSEKTRKEVFSCWDRIDVIGSDHAPHNIEDKDQSFEKAPSGIPGVETMIPLLMGWMVEKKITIPEIIQKTSTYPSEMLGLSPAGFLPGNRADFAIYPEDCTTIHADSLHSRAKWTPFEGMKAIFPEITILRGAIVFDGGEFIRPDLSSSRCDIHQTSLADDPGLSLWIPGRGYTLEKPI